MDKHKCTMSWVYSGSVCHCGPSSKSAYNHYVIIVCLAAGKVDSDLKYFLLFQ